MSRHRSDSAARCRLDSAVLSPLRVAAYLAVMALVLDLVLR